jgi:hypothetical protein
LYSAELEKDNNSLKKKLKDMSAICKRYEDDAENTQWQQKEAEEKLRDTRNQMVFYSP